jgi:hypothetical protein
MDLDGANLFTRLAPVLNVRDLAAERAFYLTCDKLVRSRSLVDVVWGLAQVVEERVG